MNVEILVIFALTLQKFRLTLQATVAPVAELEKHDTIGVNELQLVVLQHALLLEGKHDEALNRKFWLACI